MYNTEMCSYTRLRWLRWALFRITGISDTQALDAEGEQACGDISDVDLAEEHTTLIAHSPPSTLLCTEAIQTFFTDGAVSTAMSTVPSPHCIRSPLASTVTQQQSVPRQASH